MASMRARFQKDGAQDFKDVLKAYKPMGVQVRALRVLLPTLPKTSKLVREVDE